MKPFNDLMFHTLFHISAEHAVERNFPQKYTVFGMRTATHRSIAKDFWGKKINLHLLQFRQSVAAFKV